MRLINTTTGLFEEFIGRNIPKYAILSHTWEEDEVSFQAMGNSSHHTMKGFRKIEMTCQMASQSGIKYAWVDTCCIDKSSSAELTEAINSMFRWYQRAEICYVFFSDLSPSHPSLGDCRWFTRGWTLQELIAPKKIDFFDRNWKKIGSKLDPSFVAHLSLLTGISSQVLLGNQPLVSVSVAQKMSWAAKRTTTRIEDTAYSLFGIFDVNMPLLYGEEEKAFQRLQEEIIKSIADLSIFAWRLQLPAGNASVPGRVFSGFLAPSPEAFLGCNLLVKKSHFQPRDFTVSNNGVKTRVQILVENIIGTRWYRYVLPVDCGLDGRGCCGIQIRKCGPDTFVREDPYGMKESTEHLQSDAPGERYLITNLSKSTNIFMTPDLEPNTIGPQFPMPYGDRFIAQTRSHALQVVLSSKMAIHDVWPSSRFDDEGHLFFGGGNSNKGDACSMKLTSRFSLEVGRREPGVVIECGFYALGWANPDIEDLQCTLVDYVSFATRLDDLSSQSAYWGFDGLQMMNGLEGRQIPRQTSTAFDVLGTGRSVLLSFVPTLVSDLTMCRNKFWKIEFHYKVYETKNLPQLSPEKWNI